MVLPVPVGIYSMCEEMLGHDCSCHASCVSLSCMKSVSTNLQKAMAFGVECTFALEHILILFWIYVLIWEVH